jgi:tetratricopeptide (TPR) repeat protein
LDADLVRKFDTAQEVFDTAESPEDYMRSASLYEEIRRQGVVNAAVLYNQGNAYMRAGERGRAIACYRQALRFHPRDPFLQANLQYALGTYAPPAQHSILDYVLFWQDWISYPGKFQFAAGCASVAFLFGLTSLFARRRLLRRVAWAALAVTLIFVFSALYDWHRFEHTEHGVVIGDEVVARKGDGESYQPAFTSPLSEGNEFRVLERRRDWIHIRLPAGDGWVRNDAVVTY